MPQTKTPLFPKQTVVQKTITHCQQQWNIQVSNPFPDLSYNYVAPARTGDGVSCVLKINKYPDFYREIAALRHYAGDGMVNLLAADVEWGAILLERAQPGIALASLCPQDDDEATRIAAALMHQLWKPIAADHPFPTVADWGEGFASFRHAHGGGMGPLPADLFAHAERVFADLSGSMGKTVLLHADLHHYNIVTAERQAWLAIDPRGVVGEPAYEAGALLRNPMDSSKWPNLRRQLQRRLDILAEMLELDRQRLQGWGMAQAVLAACWDVEDGTHNSGHWIAIARALESHN